MKLDPRKRELLILTIMHHWPTRSSGCECGGVKLGGSFPEHVVEMYEKALEERGL